jgi:carbohydrate kinase (thermoresistant glucokinase family)
VAASVVAPRIVVLGVSGCGMSTVGRRLAERLGVGFVEGDALHPPENVRRMRAGIALTDADRHGWLQAVAAELGTPSAARAGVVASCSALRRRYRDLLRAAAPDLRFVHLHGERALLAARLAARTDHYMPPSLLDSQLQTLEPPGPDEDAWRVDIADDVDTIVGALLPRLRVPTDAAPPRPLR